MSESKEETIQCKEDEILQLLQTIENPSKKLIENLENYINNLKNYIVNSTESKENNDVIERLISFMKKHLDIDIEGQIENFDYSNNQDVEYDNYVHTTTDYVLEFQYKIYTINIEYFEKIISTLHCGGDSNIEESYYTIALNCDGIFTYNNSNETKKELKILDTDVDVETLKLGFLLLSSFSNITFWNDSCIDYFLDDHRSDGPIIPCYDKILECNTIEDFQKL